MTYLKEKQLFITLLIFLLCLSTVNVKAKTIKPTDWWDPKNSESKPRSPLDNDEEDFNKYLNGSTTNSDEEAKLQAFKKNDPNYGAYKDENGRFHYYMAFMWSDERLKKGNNTWFDAEKECEKMNGHLVTITSEKEQKYIWNHYLSGIRGYIGLKQNFKGKWEWITGEPYSGKQAWNWMKGEPNNHSGDPNASLRDLPETCAAYFPVSRTETQTKWADVNFMSTEIFGFICEWDDYTADEIEANQKEEYKALMSSYEDNKMKELLKSKLEKILII